MKRTITILALALLPVLQLKAQVKIGDNPTTINAGSILEMESTDKGVLFPRINLTDLTKWQPLAGTAIAGMTVYNTNTTTGVGLYYWDGAKWVKQLTSNNDAWLTTGNAGTTPAANFLGTTDNQPLNFRTNDTTKMTILPNGNVGVNTTTPAAKLTVYNNKATLSPLDVIVENSDAGIMDDFNFSSYGVFPNITLYFNASRGTLQSPEPLKRGDHIFDIAGRTNHNVAPCTDYRIKYMGNGTNLLSETQLWNSGLQAMVIDSLNRVGIGTTTPATKLDIVASEGQGLKLTDGSQGAGKILVSDADGKATWRYASSELTNYPYQYIGSLPVGATCPPGGSYSTPSITLPPGIYFFDHYTCNEQLGVTAGYGFNIHIEIVSGSGDASTTWHRFLNTNIDCETYYTGILRCFTECVVRKKYISYAGASSFTVTLPENSELTTFVKIL